MDRPALTIRQLPVHSCYAGRQNAELGMWMEQVTEVTSQECWYQICSQLLRLNLWIWGCSRNCYKNTSCVLRRSKVMCREDLPVGWSGFSRMTFQEQRTLFKMGSREHKESSACGMGLSLLPCCPVAAMCQSALMKKRRLSGTVWDVPHEGYK